MLQVFAHPKYSNKVRINAKLKQSACANCCATGNCEVYVSLSMCNAALIEIKIELKTQKSQRQRGEDERVASQCSVLCSALLRCAAQFVCASVVCIRWRWKLGGGKM